jgi:hypothetical protein
MAESYNVVRKTASYTLVECEGRYEVHLRNGQTIEVASGVPGKPGPPGAPGLPPSAEVIAQAIQDYLATQPPPFIQEVCPVTTEAVVAHPYSWNPSVTVVDTLGNNLGVSPIYEPGQVRIPLGDAAITVTVTLS